MDQFKLFDHNTPWPMYTCQEIVKFKLILDKLVTFVEIRITICWIMFN